VRSVFKWRARRGRALGAVRPTGVPAGRPTARQPCAPPPRPTCRAPWGPWAHWCRWGGRRISAPGRCRRPHARRQTFSGGVGARWQGWGRVRRETGQRARMKQRQGPRARPARVAPCREPAPGAGEARRGAGGRPPEAGLGQRRERHPHVVGVNVLLRWWGTGLRGVGEGSYVCVECWQVRVEGRDRLLLLEGRAALPRSRPRPARRPPRPSPWAPGRPSPARPPRRPPSRARCRRGCGRRTRRPAR
jgi:hypothetical protein